MNLLPLRPDQIAETLRRCQLPADTPILGVFYDPNTAGPEPIITVNVVGKRLVVPKDVLAQPAPIEAERVGAVLFGRPFD